MSLHRLFRAARSAAVLAVLLLAAPLSLVAQATAPTMSQAGMVVSQQDIASQVGAEVLAAGGNAIDAAIATGFALAVTHPTAGNIGGGGFMVVRFPDGTSTALDFRETAPAAAHPDMWLDENGEYSYELHHRSHQAVGIPGTVAGFDMAHRLYGRIDWMRLVSPSVDLARDGFVLSEALAGSIARFVGRSQYPATVAAFSRDGTPYEPGETWRQPDLARTLERIRDGRSDGFYHGETARLLAEEMQRGGGMITEDDLARYRARQRTPVHGLYRGYEIVSMPPPSSGGVALVTMLNILEAYDLAAMGHGSAEHLHHVAEAMRRAFRDRARYLADPDYADVAVLKMTSKAYAKVLRGDLDSGRASVSDPSEVQLPPESEETTHYSVVDSDGMAVSVTYTLEAGYGSGIVVPGAGFLLNNEMGDFNAGPGLTNASGLIGTEPNLARPGQRMLSSMTPTILVRDGRTVAVIGSPGGRTIINTVAGIVLNLVDFGMDIQDAVAAPRMHHQWLPDQLRVEQESVSGEVLQRLGDMGHDVSARGRQGSANSIGLDPATGAWIGVPDPRSPDAGARAPDATGSEAREPPPVPAGSAR